jgi:protein-L-isoaspartate(D-aspartate) O-methyltransferase
LHPGSIPGEASSAAAFRDQWGTPFPMPDFAAQRRNMVDTQLRTYDVTSHRVLDAVERVGREEFVPEALRGIAYSDQPMAVSAGEGAARGLLQTMVLGRLLQALDVKPGDRALDCAGGSGYGAALLAALGANASALEENEPLAELMRQRLAAAGVADVDVAAGDLAAGRPGDGPYDVILVHGAAEAEPKALLGQLADGGRLGIVMGLGRAGRAVVFTRSGDVVGRRNVFDAAAPSLAAFRTPPGFTF